MVGFIRPAIFSRRNGNASPPKFEPPPVQPTSRSGVSPTIANCSSASSPITVWCSNTWFSTLPSAYRGLRIGHSGADGLGDRDAEAAGMIRVLGQQRAAVVGDVADGLECTVAP